MIKKTITKAFTSIWADGHLGWYMPKFLHPNGNLRPKPEPTGYGEPIFFCKITIIPIKDKRGRYIKRYMPRK